MRYFDKIAIVSMCIGCASEPSARTWSPADYGSDYRSTGMVKPKQISGSATELLSELNCYLPPSSATLIQIKCKLGVDGALARCIASKVIAKCEDSFMRMVAKLESSYRYRPALMDGRPKEISFTYSFQMLGDGTRTAPMQPSNRRRPDSSAAKDARSLNPEDELRQIAGTMPDFHRNGSICVPPGTAATVRLSCIIGTDGTVSNCAPFPIEPVGCGEATADAIKTIEETHRYRPIVHDGRPVAVFHDFVFELLGEGIRAIRLSPVPAE